MLLITFELRLHYRRWSEDANKKAFHFFMSKHRFGNERNALLTIDYYLFEKRVGFLRKRQNNLHKIIKHKYLDGGAFLGVIISSLIKLIFGSRSAREKCFHDSMTLIVYFMKHLSSVSYVNSVINFERLDFN